MNDDTETGDLTPPSDGDVQAETPPDRDGQDAKASRLSREAAKYRVQLREAETERDGLRAELDSMRRATLTAALSNHMDAAAAKDVTGAMTGDELTALFRDGAPDPKAVAQYAAAQIEAHPYMDIAAKARQALHDSEMRRPLTGGLDPKGEPRDPFSSALGERFQRSDMG